MTLSHRYQQFGGVHFHNQTSSEASIEAIEDQKLESFEAGYQAGWDDAIKAQSDDKCRISAELAQNLQEMSFTYHEALARLTSSMKPLMEQIILKLLPAASREALAAHVLETLSDLVRQQASQPVEIVVAPRNVASITSLAEDLIAEPFLVVAEPTLGDGQAFLRVGQMEKQIDLDAVIAEITETMAAVFYHNSQGE